MVGVLDAPADLWQPAPRRAGQRPVRPGEVRAPPQARRPGPRLADQRLEGIAAVAAWAHLPEDRWVRLRAAYGGLLAERRALHAPPVSLPVPTLPEDEGRDALRMESGCLMYGVGYLVMPADKVARLGGPEPAPRDVWRERTVAHGPDLPRGASLSGLRGRAGVSRGMEAVGGRAGLRALAGGCGPGRGGGWAATAAGGRHRVAALVGRVWCMTRC